MIEKTSAYRVGDETFTTLFDAQCKAIRKITYGDNTMPEAGAEMIQQVVAKKDEVLAILQMQEGASKGRKPRSDQGKPHAKRKAKSVVETTDANTGPGIKVEGSGKYAGK